MSVRLEINQCLTSIQHSKAKKERLRNYIVPRYIYLYILCIQYVSKVARLPDEMMDQVCFSSLMRSTTYSIIPSRKVLALLEVTSKVNLLREVMAVANNDQAMYHTSYML
jgi:hypothetical protein